MTRRLASMAIWVGAILPMLMFVLLLHSPGFAQPPANQPAGAGPISDESDDEESEADRAERLATAKELFRSGVKLLEADDLERALDYFQRSRAAYPSLMNTINVALCLDKLGRYDEALEHYEETLVRFPEALTARTQAGVAAAMKKLRPKVGSLEMSSNVSGNVVIDGRSRGTLPLRAPLRVMPGTHVVRVLKDGYAAFETEVEVKPTGIARVDARLEPLAQSGGLRVEDETNESAKIYVDGAVVGVAPWEGMLAPGIHVVQSRSTEQGSQLTKAVVVQAQTTLLRLKSEPLGPVMFVEVEPSSAELLLNDVPVGKGRWEGAVPAGNYRLKAHEEGYFERVRKVTVDPAHGTTQRLRLKLKVNRDHPRWPKVPTGHLWLSLFGGFAGGGSLASSAESYCPDQCPSDAPVLGFMTGLRAAYEFPFRLSAELSGGVLWVATDVERQLETQFVDGGATHTATYSFQDEIRLMAPYVAGGASLGIPIVGSWAMRTRTSVGVFFGSSTDRLTGTATSHGATAEVDIEGAGDDASSVALFVMPELGAEYTLGSWRMGASLGALFVPQFGPDLTRGPATVPPSCSDDTPPGAIGCAPSKLLLSDERGHGPFVLWVPQINATYVF